MLVPFAVTNVCRVISASELAPVAVMGVVVDALPVLVASSAQAVRRSAAVSAGAANFIGAVSHRSHPT